MSKNNIVGGFYKAFAAGDAEKMVSYYHEQIEFEDPAFGKLSGERAKNMWRMLNSRSETGPEIVCQEIDCSERRGTASWKATYFYGPKKRKVINEIKAKFEFKDGLIIKHTDDFDLWKWTRQALGISGYLLGWSGFMKTKIKSKVNGLLDRYIENN